MFIVVVAGAGVIKNRDNDKSQTKNITQALGESYTAPQSTQSGDSGLSINSGAQQLSQDATPGFSNDLQGGDSGPLAATQDSAASSPQNATSVLDPTTFSQYDKYKDGSSALFMDLRKGEGDVVATGKKVGVLYKGWLTNGTLFDSNTDASKPFVFEQGARGVIAGWEQAIDGMKVGGVRFLVIPPSVGYGANGAPPSIPGNSVLIFQVQLIAVQ